VAGQSGGCGAGPAHVATSSAGGIAAPSHIAVHRILYRSLCGPPCAGAAWTCSVCRSGCRRSSAALVCARAPALPWAACEPCWPCSAWQHLGAPRSSMAPVRCCQSEPPSHCLQCSHPRRSNSCEAAARGHRAPVTICVMLREYCSTVHCSAYVWSDGSDPRDGGKYRKQ
jgi:hypothetical protein